VAFFLLDPAQVLVVVADVSGHDLKSAFISAWFQGTLRAMVEQAVPIKSILARFNGFLTNEWSGPLDDAEQSAPEITSLAVCAATIDLEAGSVALINGGFPLAHRIDQSGTPWSCGEDGGHPLGWVDPNELMEMSFAVNGSDRLVVWTDGLEDLASQLQVSQWSLAFRILQAKEAGQSPTWLEGAPDDVLMVVIGLEKRDPASYLFPILADSYTKDQIDDIDEFQARWRRSVVFALPEFAQQRVSEILLCTREAVLNGLQHGCSGPPDLCRLTIAFDNGSKQLRVDVADPGPGHRFDTRTQAFEQSPYEHRGLHLIQGLPQRVEQDSTGARIRMFFEFEHDSGRR
jgi:anti-sigma regulatory factor (Ser/Thr protein kinase)